jgi:hypothetical protein
MRHLGSWVFIPRGAKVGNSVFLSEHCAINSSIVTIYIVSKNWMTFLVKKYGIV